MSTDDIKPMLTEQDIDDIILTGGYRNAAGGIYATSVYAFAKEIAVAAVEASRTAVAELPDSVLTEAASELRVCAEEIKAGHAIGGEWPDGEDDARIAHNRLHKLASALERMAAIAAIQADRASHAAAANSLATGYLSDDLPTLRKRVSALCALVSAKEAQCSHLARELAELRASTNPDLLASEREANAILTDEVERLHAAPSPQGDAKLLERWAKRFGEYAQIAHKHFQRSGGGYDDGRYTAYSQCEMELFAAASAARSTPATDCGEAS